MVESHADRLGHVGRAPAAAALRGWASKVPTRAAQGGRAMASSRLARAAGVLGAAAEASAHGGLELTDDEAQNEEIDIVVAHIRRLARTASLEFASRVGAVIIHHFYAGDTEAWRSRGPKTASFRRLARHPDLPLSAGALYRCVAIFELCERLNAPARWENLGASHLRLVLGMPTAAQERVLAMANGNRWTVKTLQQAVAREKAARSTSGGRRPDPPIAKSLKSVQRSLEYHRGVIEEAPSVSRSDREETQLLIQEARESLDRLAEALGASSKPR